MGSPGSMTALPAKRLRHAASIRRSPASAPDSPNGLQLFEARVSSATLTTIQVCAAGASALTALGLARLTVRRDREVRAERNPDLRHEQLRRAVAAVRAISQAINDHDATVAEFEIAQTELATALALRPVELPALEAMLAADMPKPPYHMGEGEPFARLAAANAELLGHARAMPQADRSRSRSRLHFSLGGRR
jgi:hypothetical protein